MKILIAIAIVNQISTYVWLFLMEKRSRSKPQRDVANLKDFKLLFHQYRNYVAVQQSYSQESRFEAIQLVERCEAELERLQ